MWCSGVSQTDLVSKWHALSSHLLRLSYSTYVQDQKDESYPLDIMVWNRNQPTVFFVASWVTKVYGIYLKKHILIHPHVTSSPVKKSTLIQLKDKMSVKISPPQKKNIHPIQSTFKIALGLGCTLTYRCSRCDQRPFRPTPPRGVQKANPTSRPRLRWRRQRWPFFRLRSWGVDEGYGYTPLEMNGWNKRSCSKTKWVIL